MIKVQLELQSEWTAEQIQEALTEVHGSYGPINVAFNPRGTVLEIGCSSFEQMSWILKEYFENEDPDDWNDKWQDAVASMKVTA